MATMTLTETRQPATTSEFVTPAGRPTEQSVRPPTLRARQAPAEQAQAACQLARLAVRYAAEQVPADQAEASLIATAKRHPQALDLAADYLGYTNMADNLKDQVTALFMVEHARNSLNGGRRRWRPAATAGQLFRCLTRWWNHSARAAKTA